MWLGGVGSSGRLCGWSHCGPAVVCDGWGGPEWGALPHQGGKISDLSRWMGAVSLSWNGGATGSGVPYVLWLGF